MIRTLLATTAVAAVIAFPVIAQDTSSSMESSMDSSMMSSEMATSSMMSSEPVSSEMATSSMMSSEPMSSAVTDTTVMSSEPRTGFDIVTGYTQIESDKFVTRIIGQPVYDSGAADANHLGDINDLVLDESGNVAAVIIGVGGFLGLGEKQVAVAYPALQQVAAEDGTLRYVVQTTVEELTQAPDFVVVEVGADGQPVNNGDAMAPAGDAMAPANTTSSAM